MLSSAYYPEWLPSRQFSFFELGVPISTCLESAGVELSPTEKSEDDYNTLLEDYVFSPLATTVYTVAGVIHQIAPEKVCLFKGINLIGSNVNSMLALMDHPVVEWSSFGPCGYHGTIRELGLFLGVNEHTNVIYNVLLRSLPEEHYARQQQIMNAVSAGIQLDRMRTRGGGSAIPQFN